MQHSDALALPAKLPHTCHILFKPATKAVQHTTRIAQHGSPASHNPARAKSSRAWPSRARPSRVTDRLHKETGDTCKSMRCLQFHSSVHRLTILCRCKNAGLLHSKYKYISDRAEPYPRPSHEKGNFNSMEDGGGEFRPFVSRYSIYICSTNSSISANRPTN